MIRVPEVTSSATSGYVLSTSKAPPLRCTLTIALAVAAVWNADVAADPNVRVFALWLIVATIEFTPATSPSIEIKSAGIF